MPLAYVMGFGLATIVMLLVVLRVGQRLFSPAHTVARHLAEDNVAQRLLSVGQVLSVFLVAGSAVKNCLEGESLLHDLLWVATFALAGLLLVLLTGRAGINLLLRSRLAHEVERGNAASGLAAGAHYVATGIITSRALAGHSLRELALSLGFFVLAQVTLHVFILLFRALTTYDDAEQIQGENLAAALSYSGVTIAIALVIARALEGDFAGLAVSLKGYAAVLAFLFALYPVRQLLVQGVLLGAPISMRGGRLDQAIAGERNEGMGALEAATYLATALVVTRLL
ncbi:MAG TPA: DUF350 domain-containing protein [Polyangiaceae bacterium]|nr:DUF350 domain-containing protein [Polyangiaceae bacterium]